MTPGTLITYVIFMMLMAGLLVMLLWNWALVPAIPMLNSIGWLQGIGLFILSNIFFKVNIGSTLKKS